MKNKLPVLLIIFGAIIALLAILADLIGLGQSGGIPAVQILAAEFGIFMALAGIGLIIHKKNSQPSSPLAWGSVLDKILDLSITSWILIGFAVSFICFFIVPLIFNSEHIFQYFNGYLQFYDNLGFDIRLTLEHIRVWFFAERIPKYIYPPLTTILFAPLLLLRYPATYYVISVITLASYTILTFFLPLRLSEKKDHTIVYFVFALSVFSYPLQFELERGQFHTLAMMLSLLAVYIFHKHPKYRLFAYIAFCISVQLKVYPALFALLFVDDWRDWKTNLKRFTGLGFANFLLLFLLGFEYFSIFVSHLLGGANTNELLLDNHSIYAFVFHLSTLGFGLFNELSLTWFQNHVGLLENILYIHFLICFAAIFFKGYKDNRAGFNVDLLFVLVIGVLILPSISHDYNLTLMAAPFALFMAGFQVRDNRLIKFASILLVVIASFAYSAMLFPFVYRPEYFQNSYSLLFIVLTSLTLLSFMRKEQE